MKSPRPSSPPTYLPFPAASQKFRKEIEIWANL